MPPGSDLSNRASAAQLRLQIGGATHAEDGHSGISLAPPSSFYPKRARAATRTSESELSHLWRCCAKCCPLTHEPSALVHEVATLIRSLHLVLERVG